MDTVNCFQKQYGGQNFDVWFIIGRFIFEKIKFKKELQKTPFQIPWSKSIFFKWDSNFMAKWALIEFQVSVWPILLAFWYSDMFCWGKINNLAKLATNITIMVHIMHWKSFDSLKYLKQKEAWFKSFLGMPLESQDLG